MHPSDSGAGPGSGSGPVGNAAPAPRAGEASAPPVGGAAPAGLAAEGAPAAAAPGQGPAGGGPLPEAHDDKPMLRPIEAYPVDHPSGQKLLALYDPSGIAPGGVTLPAFGAAVIDLCDGDRTRAEICAEFAARYRRPLPPASLEALLTKLGSALLLEHLDGLPSGHILDFGCGAGVLGAALKRRYPDSQITLLDVDAFAVESSRLTLAANGLEAEVISGDGIDAAPTGLSAILSNPPFHQGVHTHYQATEHLLRQAARHLAKQGELRLVANSFLKYPPLIDQHLGTCHTLIDAKGFRIYRANKS